MIRRRRGTRYRRLLVTRASNILAVVTALAIAACGPSRGPDAAQPGTTPLPRLVVLLVIDQWPEWAFEAKRAALTGGFARMLREGEWHVGQYPYATTITAVGHALIGTGEPPSRSGILANEWWHRDLERQLKSVEAEDGTQSARWLRVPGLGDAVAAGGLDGQPGGKAISISLKSRAAILPLGHAGTAIWYDAKQVAWTSRAPVPWLAAWNASRPISAHLRDEWTPLPETPGLAGIPDDAPGESGEFVGFGRRFPHALTETSDPAQSLHATPLGNDLVIDTALEAIEREQLGADARPDLLALSLSAYDYIGHAWGQESWELWDAALRLDRRLDALLAELDARVGAGQWALLATSDHGASPMPESLRGGRITYEQIKDAANRAAIAELGPGDWVVNARPPTLYLTRAALAQKPKQLATAITKIVYALRSFPGLGRVERAADFWGRCETRTGDALALCLSLDPERSGEILYVPATGWITHPGDEPIATGHGSMQPYDQEVPVILLPPGRAARATPAAGPRPTPFPMSQVSTVIARWLGVAPPQSLRRPAPPR